MTSAMPDVESGVRPEERDPEDDAWSQRQDGEDVHPVAPPEVVPRDGERDWHADDEVDDHAPYGKPGTVRKRRPDGNVRADVGADDDVVPVLERHEPARQRADPLGREGTHDRQDDRQREEHKRPSQ